MRKGGLCQRACLSISLLPFSSWSPPSSLAPRSSSLHELLSFLPAGNESCCLWCQGEPGRGNNGAERKCQPLCARAFCALQCFCVFFPRLCVCVCASIPSHGLLKIPFTVHTHTHTHTAPLNPCRGIKQCCCSNRALFFHPPTPPLSSFVFHFPCRVISLSLFPSLSRYPHSLTHSLSVRQHLSLSFPPFPPRCFASRVVIIRNHVRVSKVELSEYWTGHSSVSCSFCLWFAHSRWTFLLWFWLLLSGAVDCSSSPARWLVEQTWNAACGSQAVGVWLC